MTPSQIITPRAATILLPTIRHRSVSNRRIRPVRESSTANRPDTMPVEAVGSMTTWPTIRSGDRVHGVDRERHTQRVA